MPKSTLPVPAPLVVFLRMGLASTITMTAVVAQLALTEMGAENLQDSRLGQNKQHRLLPLLRQSICGRLAGYEDVNDAERLRMDPAIRVESK